MASDIKYPEGLDLRTLEGRDTLVKLVLVDKLGEEIEEKWSNDARLKEDLGADSLDAVEAIMSIEEGLGHYGVNAEISDEAAGKLTTVGDVLDLIEMLVLTAA